MLEPVDEGGPFGLFGLPLFLFLPRELAGALFAPLSVELFLLPEERGVRLVPLDIGLDYGGILPSEGEDSFLSLDDVDIIYQVEGYVDE